jgi:hypothetical protein
MNNKMLWSIAVVGLVVAGCCLAPRGQGSEPPIQAAICKEKECVVAVQVAACAIRVNPDWLGVAKGNRDVEIVWEIRNSPGVTFAKEDPIFFKDRYREAAARQFREPKALSDTKYRWQNANSAPGVYHYGVRVVDNGRACPPLDPVIVDEM